MCKWQTFRKRDRDPGESESALKGSKTTSWNYRSRAFTRKEPLGTMCSSFTARLENANLFQHNLYVRKQFEHKAHFIFCLCLCLQEILGKRRKLHSTEPGRQRHTRGHAHTHTPRGHTPAPSARHIRYPIRLCFCYSFANVNFSIRKKKKSTQSASQTRLIALIQKCQAVHAKEKLLTTEEKLEIRCFERNRTCGTSRATRHRGPRRGCGPSRLALGNKRNTRGQGNIECCEINTNN